MSFPLTKPASNSLHAEDFFEWTRQQTRLLREKRFADLDLENLIDEVEAVGASEKRELRNRLKVLLSHLLKWQFQPGARSSGWRGTIDHQRAEIGSIVEDTSSLRAYPNKIFADAYLPARLLAAKETGIDVALFPVLPPFTVEQALDDGSLPKEPGLLDQS